MRPNLKTVVLRLAAVTAILVIPVSGGPAAAGFTMATGFVANYDRHGLSDLSLSTNLWRSEFVTDAAEQNDRSDGADGEGAAGQFSGPRENSDGGKQETRRSKVVRLEEQLFENQAATVETELSGTDTIAQSENQAALSDWEKAATRSSGGIGIGATSSGPSIISMVVGVVGIMIVVGAYCSSSGRT